MNFDMIFGGVGGQGILSIAYVLDNASLHQELHFKQSEVHGMAQRGGAVSSHLRISDQTIYSDMVALSGADLLLGVEPMEALRYLGFLGADGRIVSSTSPEVNIPDYPEPAELLRALLVQPGTVLLNGLKVAKEAGSHRAQNMVVLGAASPYIPLTQEVMEQFIAQLFGRKGDKVVQSNINAFRYGRATGQLFLACVEQGADALQVLQLLDHLESASVTPEAAGAWCEVLAAPVWGSLQQRFEAAPTLRMPAAAEQARQLLDQGADALTA